MRPSLYQVLLLLGWGFANISSPLFDFADIDRNSTGLLPNDRPHVLKLSGAYRVTPSFVTGPETLLRRRYHLVAQPMVP